MYTHKKKNTPPPPTHTQNNTRTQITANKPTLTNKQEEFALCQVTFTQVYVQVYVRVCVCVCMCVHVCVCMCVHVCVCVCMCVCVHAGVHACKCMCFSAVCMCAHLHNCLYILHLSFRSLEAISVTNTLLFVKTFCIPIPQLLPS